MLHSGKKCMCVCVLCGFRAITIARRKFEHEPTIQQRERSKNERRVSRTLYGHGNGSLFVITWHQVNYPIQCVRCWVYARMSVCLCVFVCILFGVFGRLLGVIFYLLKPFLGAQSILVTIVPIPTLLNALFFWPKILSIFEYFPLHTFYVLHPCMHSIKRVWHVACPEMIHAPIHIHTCIQRIQSTISDSILVCRNERIWRGCSQRSGYDHLNIDSIQITKRTPFRRFCFYSFWRTEAISLSLYLYLSFSVSYIYMEIPIEALTFTERSL